MRSPSPLVRISVFHGKLMLTNISFEYHAREEDNLNPKDGQNAQFSCLLPDYLGRIRVTGVSVL